MTLHRRMITSIHASLTRVVESGAPAEQSPALARFRESQMLRGTRTAVARGAGRGSRQKQPGTLPASVATIGIISRTAWYLGSTLAAIGVALTPVRAAREAHQRTSRSFILGLRCP